MWHTSQRLCWPDEAEADRRLAEKVHRQNERERVERLIEPMRHGDVDAIMRKHLGRDT